MQVRVTLSRTDGDGGEDDRLFILFINISLDIVDDLLFRTPDYVIRGKRKQTITFYGLSKKEAERISELYKREIIEDGLVTRVIIINSKMEEDTGPYLFVPPEYKEGVLEDLKGKPGYDLKRFVGNVVRTTYRVIVEDSLDKDREAPITSIALSMGYMLGVFEPSGTDEEELLDYITREISSEPMPSTRAPRRRRPRAPRPPRGS